MSGLASLYSVEQISQILLVKIFEIKPIAYLSTILSNNVPPASICDEIKILYASLVILKFSDIAILLLSWDSRAFSNDVPPASCHASVAACCEGERIRGIHRRSRAYIKDVFFNFIT